MDPFVIDPWRHDDVVPIKKTAKDPATGNTIYIGVAMRGTADTDAAWRIKKIFYDSDNEYDYELMSGKTAVWSNRASETYK